MAVLRSRVTSQGGTTAAALDSFDASGIAEGIVRGVHAAELRGRELGDLMGRD
jgi:pyrroline-5-carboxylate reductase